MELDSISFPPQRSHHNELPVPPLLVMSPAAQSRHKHVTIMLTTLLYPTVHLAMRVHGRARHWWKWERELCVWGACVGVCVWGRGSWRALLEGSRRHFPRCLRKVCCMIVSGFPVAGRHRGPNENMLLHHVFCTHTLQSLNPSVCVPTCVLHS